MQYASTGWTSLLRFCAVGLFVVSAIIYWGAWTPTTASGLLAAGLACFAASSLFVPERTAQRRHRERLVADEPMTRERVVTDPLERERVGGLSDRDRI